MLRNDDKALVAQGGSTLLEVLIAFVLLTLASLAILAVYERQGVGVISLTQSNQAFSILEAGETVLRTTKNQQNYNGSVITATSAPSGLNANTVAPLQSTLSQLQGAQLQWQIHPLYGASVCPCAVTQSLSWKGGSAQSTTVVGY